MTIGEELKFCRLQAGKTQSEWIGELMSESFYSKVERGIHSIDADLLLQILIRNHISLEKFFSLLHIDNATDPDFQLKQKIREAQYNVDLTMLDEIKEKIKAKHHGKIEPYRTRRELEFAYAWVTHSNKFVSKDTQKKTFKVFNHEDWDYDSYLTLAEVLIVMDLKQGSSMVHSALRDFNKKYRSTDEYACISILISNYLNCLYHWHADWSYYQEPIKFIRKLPNDPVLAKGKILATYYEALYKHDQKTIDEVTEIFKKSGLYPWIEDTVQK